MNELLATPQVFIIGTIKDAENFGKKSEDKTKKKNYYAMFLTSYTM